MQKMATDFLRHQIFYEVNFTLCKPFLVRISQKIISLICFWNIELNSYLLLIFGISRKKSWDVEHNFPVQKVEIIGFKIAFVRLSHLSGKTRIFADQISARFRTTCSSEVTPTKALGFWKRLSKLSFFRLSRFELSQSQLLFLRELL